MQNTGASLGTHISSVSNGTRNSIVAPIVKKSLSPFNKKLKQTLAHLNKVLRFSIDP